MKNLLTKKNILLTGLVGALFLIIAMFPVDLGICEKNSYDCRTNFDFLQDIVSVFPIMFFFSLITYKMRDEVFDHWMKFAVWAVPTMMLLTYLILGGASQGGLGIESAYGGSFDAFLFMLLYGIFIGVSIYRIVSKYRELKYK